MQHQHDIQLSFCWSGNASLYWKISVKEAYNLRLIISFMYVMEFILPEITEINLSFLNLIQHKNITFTGCHVRCDAISMQIFFESSICLYHGYHGHQTIKHGFFCIITTNAHSLTISLCSSYAFSHFNLFIFSWLI